MKFQPYQAVREFGQVNGIPTLRVTVKRSHVRKQPFRLLKCNPHGTKLSLIHRSLEEAEGFRLIDLKSLSNSFQSWQIMLSRCNHAVSLAASGDSPVGPVLERNRDDFASAPCISPVKDARVHFSSAVARLGYCLTPYQQLRLYNAPHLVAFYDTLGIRRTYSRLKPPASPRGSSAVAGHCQIQLCRRSTCVLSGDP